MIMYYLTLQIKAGTLTVFFWFNTIAFNCFAVYLNLNDISSTFESFTRSASLMTWPLTSGWT